MGSLYRLSSGAFAIGDRVCLGDVCGDVLDIGLFSTKLSEVGPTFGHSGRVVVVPNSVFLSSTIINESESGPCILHELRVPLADQDDWRRAEAELLEIALDVCGRYIDDTRTSLLALSSQQDWEVPANEEPRAHPTVAVQFDDKGALQLNLRVPVPARSKGRIEQKIIRAFLDRACGVASPPPGDPQ
jgi:small-conductance mechanosensitive channel